MLVPMKQSVSGSSAAAATRSSRCSGRNGSSRTWRPSRTTDSGRFMHRSSRAPKSAPHLELGAGSRGDLRLHPSRDLAPQRLQRNRPVREHLVVEGPDVESLTHPAGDLVPCPLNLALAELVRQGLTGPDGVSVHLDLGVDD